MTYAAATTVPFERSIADIVTVIKRAGAQPIAIEYQTGRPDHVAGLLGGPQV